MISSGLFKNGISLRKVHAHLKHCCFTNTHWQAFLRFSLSAMRQQRQNDLYYTRTKIQDQVWISSLLFWVYLRSLTLLACIYRGLVNRTENIAHGSDLNCVISTWWGGGLYLYSSHIPYKFFKEIKSCGGTEGRREGEETYTNPKFSMLSHSCLEGWLFSHNTMESLLLPISSEIPLTLHTLRWHAAYISGRSWQCASSSRTRTVGREHYLIYFLMDAVTISRAVY